MLLCFQRRGTRASEYLDFIRRPDDLMDNSHRFIHLVGVLGYQYSSTLLFIEIELFVIASRKGPLPC